MNPPRTLEKEAPRRGGADEAAAPGEVRSRPGDSFCRSGTEIFVAGAGVLGRLGKLAFQVGNANHLERGERVHGVRWLRCLPMESAARAMVWAFLATARLAS